MDANGGCGLVLSISQSVCQAPNQALYYCFYYIKLWLEILCLNSYKIKSIVYTGIPLLYMLVILPLRFLVNTDSTGHHYGQNNAQNGKLLAYVYMHVKLFSKII